VAGVLQAEVPQQCWQRAASPGGEAELGGQAAQLLCSMEPGLGMR
jgi:hypothetical protein